MDLVSKLRPGLSGKQLVLAGNVAGFLIIILAALWAPQIDRFGSVVKYFQQLLSYMAPPIVAVFLAGLFWKRASATGAFTALLFGFATALAMVFFKHLTPLAGWHFLYVAPLIFIASLVPLVGVSLATEPPSASTVERYVWRPAFFQAESETLVGVPWFKNYRVQSALVLIGSLGFFLVWR
jgi:SSS family solute:Na+ symporter